MSRAAPGSRGPRGSSRSTASAIRGPPSAASSHAAAAASSLRPPGTSSASSSSHYALHSTGIIGHKDKSGRIVSYTSPDDKCPSCKTDRFLNPKLKLLVSPCYHKLCTSCIDRIWSLGPAPCPTCGTVCRKSQFGPQTFQDLGVEREVDVRKRIQKSYNKQQADFPSLKEYNDYLEEIEQITFNLINRVDYEATLSKLTTYENANRTSSNRNNAQSETDSNAQASLEAHLLQLRRARMEKRKGYEAEDMQSKRDEEEEIVRVLEDGLEEEEIAAVQDKWKKMREQREQRRDCEEEEALRKEEEIRRGIQGAKRRDGGAGEDAQEKKASMAANGSSTDWTPHSLQGFTGPLTTLSTGLELFIDPSTKQRIALLPPSRLLVDAAGGKCTSAATAAAATLCPYDPWTQPLLDKMQPEEVEVIKAGGFDWCENWMWDLSVAAGSLAVAANTNPTL